MKSLYLVLIALFSVILFSCSEPTMDDDARKAAELSTLSNQYSMDSKMNDAGRAYGEVQEIMQKYKKLDKFDEFYELYITYLQETSHSLEKPEGFSDPD